MPGEGCTRQREVLAFPPPMSVTPDALIKAFL